MTKNSRITAFSLALLFTLPALGSSSQYEISQYRFRRHKDGKFERLVLEFQKKAGAHGAPTVTTAPSGTGVRIKVDGAVILGGIPESAINESYVGSSRLLGGIAMEMEGPTTGFSVSAALKDPGVKTDAFWLANPDRLVVDVYPQGVASPKSRMSRNTASHATKKNEKFYCFPANAQVGLSVLFQPKFRHQDSRVRIDLEASPNGADTTSDAIVCYPSSTQVEPSISFHDGQYLTPVPVKERETSSTSSLPTSREEAKAPAHKAVPTIQLPEGAKTEHQANKDHQANPSSLLPAMK